MRTLRLIGCCALAAGILLLSSCGGGGEASAPVGGGNGPSVPNPATPNEPEAPVGPPSPPPSGPTQPPTVLVADGDSNGIDDDVDARIRANYVGQRRTNAERYAKAFFALIDRTEAGAQVSDSDIRVLMQASECHVVGVGDESPLLLSWVRSPQRLAAYIRALHALTGWYDLRSDPLTECGLQSTASIPTRPLRDSLDRPAPQVCAVQFDFPRLLYVNGVFTTEQQAIRQASELQRTAANLVAKTKASFYYFPPVPAYLYIPTNPLTDLSEVYIQKAREAKPTLSHQEAYQYLFEPARVPAELADLVQTTLRDDLVATSRMQTDYRVTYYEQRLLLKLVEHASERVLLVAHSQGNLFANPAVKFLLMPELETSYNTSITYLAIASPANTVQYAHPRHPGINELRALSATEKKIIATRQYITSSNDLVIDKLLRLYATTQFFLPPLPSNDRLASNGELDEPVASGDLAGHGFLETYLKAPAFQRRLTIALKLSADYAMPAQLADSRVAAESTVSFADIAGAERHRYRVDPIQVHLKKLPKAQVRMLGEDFFIDGTELTGVEDSETATHQTRTQTHACRSAVVRFKQGPAGTFRILTGWWSPADDDGSLAHAPYFATGWGARYNPPLYETGPQGWFPHLVVSAWAMNEALGGVQLQSFQYTDISWLASLAAPPP